MTDVPEDNIALILQNYGGLIKNIAFSAVKSSSVINEEDLFQVGIVAALRATRLYDPSYGTSLKAYIGQAIRRAIYNEAASFLGVFTVDRRVTEIAARVNRMAEKGKTDEEIANHLNKTLQRNFDANHVRDLRIAYSGRNMTAEVEDRYLIEAEVKSIESLIQDVPENDIEQTILRDRILGKVKASEVGYNLGISRRKVYEIERALVVRIEQKIKDECL